MIISYNYPTSNIGKKHFSEKTNRRKLLFQHFSARHSPLAPTPNVPDVPFLGTSVLKTPLFTPDVPVFGTSVTVAKRIRRPGASPAGGQKLFFVQLLEKPISAPPSTTPSRSTRPASERTAARLLQRHRTAGSAGRTGCIRPKSSRFCWEKRDNPFDFDGVVPDLPGFPGGDARSGRA